MKKIKILIIDDSNMVHVLLEKILEGRDDIEISGNAYDGKEGIALVKKLSPDVIIMDIGMPEMNGLEAIEQIMEEKPTPIIVFSAASGSIVDLGFKAIELGAVELVEKPFSTDLTSLKNNIEEKLIKSIINFSDFKVIRHIKKAPRYAESDKTLKNTETVIKSKSINQSKESKTDKKITSSLPSDEQLFPVIGVAASTGGPQTLRTFLHELASYNINAAFIIVQHMAEGFMLGFTEWLAEYTTIPVVIPENGSSISAGHIYVAPGEFHLAFGNTGKFLFIDSPPIQGIRPSADIMFASLANVYKNRAIGVILTGMGSDGTEGLLKVKDKGGYVIAQDEESSLIFGMPKSAIEAGAADIILSLNDIPAYLDKICSERFAKKI